MNVIRSGLIDLVSNQPARNASKVIGFLLASASILWCTDAAAAAHRSISHFAIFAHDYEKSRSFYGGFLGFEEPYSLKNPDGSASMTFFKVNDHQYIELFPEHEAKL